MRNLSKPFAILAVAVVIFGAFIAWIANAPAPIAETKVVKAKLAPIESVVNNIDLEVHPQTVYYLVADDGSVAKVSVGEYGATEIGSEFTSEHWDAK